MRGFFFVEHLFSANGSKVSGTSKTFRKLYFFEKCSKSLDFREMSEVLLKIFEKKEIFVFAGVFFVEPLFSANGSKVSGISKNLSKILLFEKLFEIAGLSGDVGSSFEDFLKKRRILFLFENY